ncbi:MAG: ribosome silencing factor [Candidatus Omnitrophica bacterium]|nr:ribosome silencing factor [Candidatus Omnitrophota bacterium]
MAGKEKALKIVDFILSRKAKDVVVLNVGEVSGFCDYFIICSGDSARQVKAIHDETVKLCKLNKIEIYSHQDDESCRWILIDLFDVVLHVFLEEAREFYGLEQLWKTAKKVKIKLQSKST